MGCDGRSRLFKLSLLSTLLGEVSRGVFRGGCVCGGRGRRWWTTDEVGGNRFGSSRTRSRCALYLCGSGRSVLRDVPQGMRFCELLELLLHAPSSMGGLVEQKWITNLSSSIFPRLWGLRYKCIHIPLRGRESLMLVRDPKLRSMRLTPFKPSRPTEKASRWVTESNGTIFMCCFGGTCMIVAKKSSLFVECFPVGE